ncbi:hypothetical protein [Streptomyces sp. NPDC051684]|uniref:hypothetical protein n=1 Tax=Streptomyces sp. NPDC051684 TaxID=3365670 RepID=UPI003793976D
MSTIQSIERGHEFGKPTRTIRAYAKLLNWADGSIEQVLSGGNPSHEVHGAAALNVQASMDADLDDKRLPLRIVHELSDDGTLLDTAVLKIGDKGRAIVVVKGEPGVSAEELVEELRAWDRSRARLESGDDTDPPAAANGS